jgi:hypothetical protein
MSTTVKTQAIWPQSILVADMAWNIERLRNPQTSHLAGCEYFRIPRRTDWCGKPDASHDLKPYVESKRCLVSDFRVVPIYGNPELNY